MMTDESAVISPTWAVGMTVVNVLGLLVFGYIIYRAVTQPSRQRAALVELSRAYARGDLTQEEFQQREEDLRRTK